MGLSLEKRTQTLGLSLAKKSIAKIVACVGSAMDISGSMNSLYRNGTMAEYTSRLAPLGQRVRRRGQGRAWNPDGCSDVRREAADTARGARPDRHAARRVEGG